MGRVGKGRVLLVKGVVLAEGRGCFVMSTLCLRRGWMREWGICGG